MHRTVAVFVWPQVDSAYSAGDDVRARSKSKQALGFALAAIAIGIVIHVGWLGPIIYFITIIYGV